MAKDTKNSIFSSNGHKIAPKHHIDNFSIIGIGASAGGLEALKAFFDHVPSECHHSFVVVQHLSPDYKSHMAELLGKNTSLPVDEVKNNTTVEPGKVYLIPPKKNMTLSGGKLILTNKPTTNELNLPIDIFFRSLAKERKEKAIAIVLSGTGSDGTSGVRNIKELNGMVMVQSPVQAKFDGMPQSALNTGLVDYVLPVESLASELINYIEHPDATGDLEKIIEKQEPTILKILKHLNHLTNFDFEHYKRPTLVRRISRRMGMNKLDELSHYKDFLYENANECHILVREFLIGVTSFFRDPEVWEVLQKEVIPKIVLSKSNDDTIKIWCAGTSTGEEAYSMAILLNEELSRQKKKCIVKIFATDLEKTHLEIGSRGLYAESIVAHVSMKRLNENFLKKGDEYQIKESIRRMVIFSHHNVLKDPPFNKMDLSICRNLLIYMQPIAQKRIIGILQYSLNLNGVLVLGSSETVGDYKKVFKEINRKLKIYRNLHPARTLGMEVLNYPNMAPARNFTPQTAQKKLAENRMYEAMNETIADELGVAGVRIDNQYNIVNAIGEFKNYIELPERGFSVNLLKMVPENVSSAISLAIRKVNKNHEKIKFNSIKFKQDSKTLVVDLLICPFSMGLSQEESNYLILFFPKEEQESTAISIEDYTANNSNIHVAELEAELKDTRQNLQTLLQEVETSNEELQAANEELLSANEELQSTNEELQSVNEELHTVNAELQQKVEDLATVNVDMDNLLKSTDIGTIFLDREMRVRKFTPTIRKYFSLRENDIQRPLEHFSNSFGNSGKEILEIAEEVLKSGKYIQKEVSDSEGNWFLQRTIPFYNVNQTIDGVVISFIDINELKKVEKALKNSESEFRKLYDNAPDMFVSIDLKGNILNCNKKLIEKLNYSSIDDLINVPIASIMHPDYALKSKEDRKELVREGKISNALRVVIKKGGGEIPIRLNAEAIYNKDGKLSHFIGSWRDVSDIQEAEQKYAYQNTAFEQVLESTMAGYWDWLIQEGTEYMSPSFKMMFGYEDDEVENVPEAWQKLIHPEDLPEVLKTFDKHLKEKDPEPFDIEVRYYHKDGNVVWVWCKGRIIEWDNKGNPVRMVGSHVNITHLKNIQQRLSQSNKALERFAYIASHDLQEPLRTINDFIDLLKEDYTSKLDENADTYMRFISEASNRMGQLVKGILAYSRIGAIGENKKVDLNKILENVKKDLRLKILDRNVVFENDKLPKINGNEYELHSLLLNIIGNAIKFVPPEVNPVIKISSKKEGVFYLISISDNGIGIDKKHKEQIFDIFKRLHNSDKYEGTGIGLAHCKRIIELHGGEIWVDSELGKGSSFHFTLNTQL
jgi:two-component system CheB/CheR fusion protein